MTAKYLVASALWGAAWGGIGVLMGLGKFSGESLLIGALASPGIGAIMGILSSPIYSFPFLVRFLSLPVLVYAGAFLFGMAISIRGPFEESLQRNAGLVMIGTTYFLFILVPVAFFTHFSLGYLRKPPVKAYRG